MEDKRALLIQEARRRLAESETANKPRLAAALIEAIERLQSPELAAFWDEERAPPA
jgi:hypothetical protein